MRLYRPVETIRGNYKKPCACGCGELIWNRDKFYRLTSFVHGHSTKLLNKTRKGDKHYAWKGGRFIHHTGYAYVYRNGRYIYEHRAVYEEHYKCCLLPSTIIHHKDGNKLNNKIRNLRPMTASEHRSLHNKMLLIPRPII